MLQQVRAGLADEVIGGAVGGGRRRVLHGANQGWAQQGGEDHVGSLAGSAYRCMGVLQGLCTAARPGRI